jgi:hypothetical protein
VVKQPVSVVWPEIAIATLKSTLKQKWFANFLFYTQ